MFYKPNWAVNEKLNSESIEVWLNIEQKKLGQIIIYPNLGTRWLGIQYLIQYDVNCIVKQWKIL